jgi:hypothetical protein
VGQLTDAQVTPENRVIVKVSPRRIFDYQVTG